MNTTFLPSSDLIIPDNRHRQEFSDEALQALADSIESKGLMNPLTVRDDGRTLVAGERRSRAITFLHNNGRAFECQGQTVPEGHYPVLPLSSLSPFQLREAELEENVLREDLTWQEKAAAIYELDQLRREQKEQTGEVHRTIDTVRELAGESRSLGNTYRDVNAAKDLAPLLDDPEVAAAKTQKEALKIVHKRREAEHRRRLSEAFNPQSSQHQILEGDCLGHLEQLTESSIDVLCTDPPYGMGADSFGSMASERHEYEDDADWFRTFIPKVVAELSRVMKPDSHIYLFCDNDQFPFLRDLFAARNWSVFRTPLIWSKGGGMLPWPEHGPRRTYETILFAQRGDLKVTDIYPDVISIPKLQKPTFGAEKPPALFVELLRRSVFPGAVVLDPFAGAGPIIPAANYLELQAIAMEMNPDKISFIKQRISEIAEPQG